MRSEPSAASLSGPKQDSHVPSHPPAWWCGSGVPAHRSLPSLLVAESLGQGDDVDEASEGGVKFGHSLHSLNKSFDDELRQGHRYCHSGVDISSPNSSTGQFYRSFHVRKKRSTGVSLDPKRRVYGGRTEEALATKKIVNRVDVHPQICFSKEVTLISKKGNPWSKVRNIAKPHVPPQPLSSRKMLSRLQSKDDTGISVNSKTQTDNIMNGSQRPYKSVNAISEMEKSDNLSVLKNIEIYDFNRENLPKIQSKLNGLNSSWSETNLKLVGINKKSHNKYISTNDSSNNYGYVMHSIDSLSNSLRSSGVDDYSPYAEVTPPPHPSASMPQFMRSHSQPNIHYASSASASYHYNASDNDNLCCLSYSKPNSSDVDYYAQSPRHYNDQRLGVNNNYLNLEGSEKGYDKPLLQTTGQGLPAARPMDRVNKRLKVDSYVWNRNIHCDYGRKVEENTESKKYVCDNSVEDFVLYNGNDCNRKNNKVNSGFQTKHEANLDSHDYSIPVFDSNLKSVLNPTNSGISPDNLNYSDSSCVINKTHYSNSNKESLDKNYSHSVTSRFTDQHNNFYLNNVFMKAHSENFRRINSDSDSYAKSEEATKLNSYLNLPVKLPQSRVPESSAPTFKIYDGHQHTHESLEAAAEVPQPLRRGTSDGRSDTINSFIKSEHGKAISVTDSLYEDEKKGDMITEMDNVSNEMLDEKFKVSVMNSLQTIQNEQCKKRRKKKQLQKFFDECIRNLYEQNRSGANPENEIHTGINHRPTSSSSNSDGVVNSCPDNPSMPINQVHLGPPPSSYDGQRKASGTMSRCNSECDLQDPQAKHKAVVNHQRYAAVTSSRIGEEGNGGNGKDNTSSKSLVVEEVDNLDRELHVITCTDKRIVQNHHDNPSVECHDDHLSRLIGRPPPPLPTSKEDQTKPTMPNNDIDRYCRRSSPRLKYKSTESLFDMLKCTCLSAGNRSVSCDNLSLIGHCKKHVPRNRTRHKSNNSKSDYMVMSDTIKPPDQWFNTVNSNSSNHCDDLSKKSVIQACAFPSENREDTKSVKPTQKWSNQSLQAAVNGNCEASCLESDTDFSNDSSDIQFDGNWLLTVRGKLFDDGMPESHLPHIPKVNINNHDSSACSLTYYPQNSIQFTSQSHSNATKLTTTGSKRYIDSHLSSLFHCSQLCEKRPVPQRNYHFKPHESQQNHYTTLPNDINSSIHHVSAVITTTVSLVPPSTTTTVSNNALKTKGSVDNISVTSLSSLESLSSSSNNSSKSLHYDINYSNHFSLRDTSGNFCDESDLRINKSTTFTANGRLINDILPHTSSDIHLSSSPYNDAESTFADTVAGTANFSLSADGDPSSASTCSFVSPQRKPKYLPVITSTTAASQAATSLSKTNNNTATLNGVILPTTNAPELAAAAEDGKSNDTCSRNNNSDAIKSIGGGNLCLVDDGLQSDVVTLAASNNASLRIRSAFDIPSKSFQGRGRLYDAILDKNSEILVEMTPYVLHDEESRVIDYNVQKTSNSGFSCEYQNNTDSCESPAAASGFSKQKFVSSKLSSRRKGLVRQKPVKSKKPASITRRQEGARDAIDDEHGSIVDTNELVFGFAVRGAAVARDSNVEGVRQRRRRRRREEDAPETQYEKCDVAAVITDKETADRDGDDSSVGIMLENMANEKVTSKNLLRNVINEVSEVRNNCSGDAAMTNDNRKSAEEEKYYVQHEEMKKNKRFLTKCNLLSNLKSKDERTVLYPKDVHALSEVISSKIKRIYGVQEPLGVGDSDALVKPSEYADSRLVQSFLEDIACNFPTEDTPEDTYAGIITTALPSLHTVDQQGCER